VETDLLVGSDGIKSAVRASRDLLLLESQAQSQTQGPAGLKSHTKAATGRSKVSGGGSGSHQLQYLDVSVILGLSTCEHPLLTGRGFYVVDGVNRLFTMPFSERNSADPTSRQLCMWQLSFSGLSEGV
jgi:hypothetical protein